MNPYKTDASLANIVREYMLTEGSARPDVIETVVGVIRKMDWQITKERRLSAIVKLYFLLFALGLAFENKHIYTSGWLVMSLLAFLACGTEWGFAVGKPKRWSNRSASILLPWRWQRRKTLDAILTGLKTQPPSSEKSI